MGLQTKQIQAEWKRMKNYKIVIQYEGTKYLGWQRQESSNNTIQGKFEAILEKLCGSRIEIQASGRTDSGVHAYGQVANFKMDTQLSSIEIMEYMNQYLPEDIAVISIEEVPLRFHSRLNAKGKTYQYRVRNSKTPDVFNRRYVYQINETLDLAAMQRAADYLIGQHDFKAFTSTKKGKKPSIRTIDEIRIEQIKDEIIFVFTGNGFLYHMVRILTGTLLEIGQGIKKPEDMSAILESGSRENAGPLVPSLGLALMDVKY